MGVVRTNWHLHSISGGLRRVGDPDQCPHLHQVPLVLEMPRIPATPANWSRSHPPEGKKRQTQGEGGGKAWVQGSCFGGNGPCFHGAGLEGGQGERVTPDSGTAPIPLSPLEIQHCKVDYFTGAAILCQQPPSTGVSELLSEYEWAADLMGSRW